MQLEYSPDGTVLISCKDAQPSVRVQEGCRVIGHKAFMHEGDLEHVELPSTLERIEEFAFSNTGLVEFTAPRNLRSIAQKAFFKNPSLVAAELNEGLLEIGADAFTATALEHLELPASLEQIPQVLASQTPLWNRRPGSLVIDTENEHYRIDAAGGIYKKERDGFILVGMSSSKVKRHNVLPGTIAIGPRAYKGVGGLETVSLPEGLREIGDEAFRGCASLSAVRIPQTLESIGERAFYDTGLRSFSIPSSLRVLGAEALLTGDEEGPTLFDLVVADTSENFYLENGVLCERNAAEDGGDIAHGFFSESATLAIPDAVTAFAPHAFARCIYIDELHVGPQVKHTPPSSLISRAFVNRIIFHFDDPACESDELELLFATSRGVRFLLSIALEREGLDPVTLAEVSDKAAPSIRDIFTRSTWLLSRLQNPLFMKDGIREEFLLKLERDLPYTCELFARRGHLEGFNRLVEEGLLTKDNIGDALDIAMPIGDASVTAHLLAIKQKLGARRETMTI